MVPIRPATDPGAVTAAASALLAGGVIAIPTDTVYGVAALPTVHGATARVFALKGRRADVPLAVLCADPAQALALVDPSALDERVHDLAARFWPGPLTIVALRRRDVALDLGEPPTTIGLRCPDHDFVRDLAAEVGPIATTSANRHGEPTPLTAAEVAAVLGDGLALVVDGGPLDGIASTVVDVTVTPWKILRAGAISATALGVEG